MKVNAMKNNFLIPILCIVAAMACAGCRSVEDPGFSVYYNKDIMNNPAKAELWLVQYIQGNLTECKSRVDLYEWNGEEYYYVYHESGENSFSYPTAIYRKDGSIYVYAGDSLTVESGDEATCFMREAVKKATLFENNPCER